MLTFGGPFAVETPATPIPLGVFQKDVLAPN